MSRAGKIVCSVLVFGFVLCLLAESASGHRFHGKFGGQHQRKGNFSRSGKFKEIFGNDRTDVPDFCHKRACPKFTVSDSTEDYEVRQYEASNWLAIKRTSDSRNKRRMFRVLFDYIRGNNSENRTVQMGVPVLKKLVPGQDKSEDMVMLFYMNEANLPKPNDSRIYFVNLPAQTYYVRVFGGYAYKKLNEENREKLIEAIGKEKVDTTFYYGAGYDAPWVKKDRHNEIWVLAKN